MYQCTVLQILLLIIELCDFDNFCRYTFPHRMLLQLNLVISNSVNSNFRLYRSWAFVPATSHYKRRGKHRIFPTQIYRISGYIE